MASAGIYSLVVSGSGGTTGIYTLQAILNAVYTQPSDHINTIGTAYDLTSAFGPLGTTPSADRAGALGTLGPGKTVGYYTDFNPFDTSPANAITQAGLTPLQITNIATFDLSSIGILMVDESNNGGLSSDLLNRLPDIQNWVEGGGVFIVHDRFVSPSEGDAEHNPFVLGEPNTLTQLPQERIRR